MNLIASLRRGGQKDDFGELDHNLLVLEGDGRLGILAEIGAGDTQGGAEGMNGSRRSETDTRRDTIRASELTLSTGALGCDDFLTPVPIRKQNEDPNARGAGYDYECYNILEGFEVPMYEAPLHITSPFGFQVAGHDPFLKADSGLLCKPVVPRELWFYLCAPDYPHYAMFLPEFLGCVEFPPDDVRRFAASVKAFDSHDTDHYITPWAEKLHQGHLERALPSRPHHILLLRLSPSPPLLSDSYSP